MGVKLYNVVDSPPCTAVRMALKYLKVEYEIVEIDMEKGEHQSPDFLKINPVGQIPVLEDGNFVLCESVAILQYVADKFKKDESFYPEGLQKRGFVNQLLAFHASNLYPAIASYFIYPAVFGNDPTDFHREMVKKSLKAFEGILTKQNTTYAAGNEVTIADLALSTSIYCCEALGPFDFSPYPRLKEWYEEFQKTEIWIVANEGLETLKVFLKNIIAKDQ